MTGVLKVGLTGVLPNNEVWSVNPVYDLPTGDFPLTYSELNTIATAINAITTPTGVRAIQNTATGWDGVKLEHREKTGALLGQLEQKRSGIQLGTGGQNNPPQTSMVISLRTSGSGGSRRGRLYWPATGATIGASNLRFDPAQASAFLTAVKTFLSGVGTAISATSAGAELVVWSRTLASTQDVNRMLVGDVPDVQRRRRDKAVETYQQVSYP